jgi:hypothetical protein
MTRQKKPRVKRKSGLTGVDQEAEARALVGWLQMVDRPLGIKEGDKRRGRQRRRRAKRRGNQ